MVVNKDTNPLDRKQDFVHVAILLTIALGIGIYLIATTVLIAKDGVSYIQFAKKLTAEPLQAMRDSSIHPGYPFFIFVTNKLTSFFCVETSSESWATSALCASLLSKIVATVLLYLVGSILVGPKMSFWGVLILTFLPIPAKYVDALTEWPHVMLFTMGIWLLLLGAKLNNGWIFGCVGIIAGLGYLISQECCQLVLYGLAWLIVSFISPQDKMSRVKSVIACVLLLAGFVITAVPYMKFKGYIFPKFFIGPLPRFVSMREADSGTINAVSMYLAGIVPVEIVKGAWELFNNICVSLMYYFIIPYFVGVYYYFRKEPRSREKFFVTVFVLFNVAMLLWYYCRGGALSKRYSFPLVALTIFYVPVGMRLLSDWFYNSLFRGRVPNDRNVLTLFLVLILVGLAICIPKLLRPNRIEKKAYRSAARWLKENTEENVLVNVPDSRIGFYAERQWVVSSHPEKADYIVRISKKGDDEKKQGNENLYKLHSLALHKKSKIVIYRKGNQ